MTNSQSGNILVIILLAIILIGALTVAIQGTGQQNANIDKESLIIRATEVQRYASELARGVAFIVQNGHSETDIRFAHPNANTDYGDLGADADTTDQVFAKDGGGAMYRLPPENINDGSAWEFYGHTALPEVGSDRAELIAVLPNVSQEFCVQVNELIGYDPTVQPADPATCIHGGASVRFDAATQYNDATPNTVNDVTFSIKPSMQACVRCGAFYHYYYVLMAR